MTVKYWILIERKYSNKLIGIRPSNVFYNFFSLLSFEQIHKKKTIKKTDIGRFANTFTFIVDFTLSNYGKEFEKEV